MASSDPRDLYKSILMRESLPLTMDRRRESGWARLLAAFGESSNNIGGLFGKANFLVETTVGDQDRSAVQQARDSMLNDTAEGKYLTEHGANYGVVRPPQSPFDDALFRKLIPILAMLPKTPLLVPWRLAEAIFGTQEEVEAAYGAKWEFYEIRPNEIIFECPHAIISGTPATASHMHGYSGLATAMSGPTNLITSAGPDARLAASSLNGLSLYIFHTGAWQLYTITSALFNAGVNSFILNAATIPNGVGMPFYISVPASASYSGDVMLADATIPAGGVNTPSDLLVYLFGKATLDIFEFYMNKYVRASGVILRTEVL